MKLTATLSLILTLSVSSHASAQSEEMKDMDMKGMKEKQTNHSKTIKHQANAVVMEW